MYLNDFVLDSLSISNLTMLSFEYEPLSISSFCVMSNAFYDLVELETEPIFLLTVNQIIGRSLTLGLFYLYFLPGLAISSGSSTLS